MQPFEVMKNKNKMKLCKRRVYSKHIETEAESFR